MYSDAFAKQKIAIFQALALYTIINYLCHSTSSTSININQLTQKSLPLPLINEPTSNLYHSEITQINALKCRTLGATHGKHA